MTIILSPSKSVTNKPAPIATKTNILFESQSHQLVVSLKKLTTKKLKRTLGVSEQLAQLNYQRYQSWLNTDTKAAVYLYSGDVYNGLDSFTMDASQIAYAQKHIRIVSGLYGIVRPLDAIRPYRLEMKLPYRGPWGKDLYQAWSSKIADYFVAEQETTIVLCASKEYSRSVTQELPDSIRVITPRFMQETDTGLVEKGLFAKYARGALARYAIDNEVKSVEQLHDYNKDGFYYSAQESSQNELVYIVPPNFTLKGRFTKQ